ncbi:MAG: M23 family metallopeptidase [Clostridia bacterium]|nr:M23 family metallopeptidase [Clostridia bacterium]
MDNEKSVSNARKVVYVCVFLAIVAIVATVIAIVAANSDNASNVGTSASVSASRNSASGSASGRSSNSGSASGSGGGSGNAQPTVKEVAFIMPVEGGEVLKDYTAATVVYNQTLGIFTGHLALDVGGAVDANVFAAYDGEIESITTGYLEGTTVTVNHGNGLKTVYNSIEADEGLSVGDKVMQGDVIGVISTNNRQEYKDGAHLHFEVWENGEKISPFKYLTIDEK